MAENSVCRIDSGGTYAANSMPTRVRRGGFYRASFCVTGFYGQEYSAYLAVIFIDSATGTEVGRRVRWLNDFSGIQKEYALTFRAGADSVMCGYRVNAEAPVRSRCSLKMTPVEAISVEGIKGGHQVEPVEDWDDVDDYVLPRPMELNRWEEEDVEANLVWVVGSARGGTTWLGTQLLSYGTNVIDETQLGHHLGSRNDWFGGEFVRDMDCFCSTPQYIFSRKYEQTWRYHLRKMILNRIHAEIPDTLGQITVIKDPSSSVIADTISGCLPDSRIIFLLRDGRDVIDSVLDAFSKDGWMTKALGTSAIPAGRRMQFITENAMLWKKRTEVMLKAYGSHREDRRYLVRYEQLRRDTAAELERIYGFLGITVPAGKVEEIVSRYSFEGIPEEMRGDGKFYRSASPGRWKQNLSDEENAAVDAIIGQTLRRLGYD